MMLNSIGWIPITCTLQNQINLCGCDVARCRPNKQYNIYTLKNFVFSCETFHESHLIHGNNHLHIHIGQTLGERESLGREFSVQTPVGIYFFVDTMRIRSFFLLLFAKKHSESGIKLHQKAYACCCVALCI